jgi:hypothetical protein
MNRLSPVFLQRPTARSERVSASDCHTLHPDACASRPKLCPCDCGDFLSFFCRTARFYQPRKVATMQLSTFLNERQVRQIEYLKIDAQGSDFGILRDVLENTAVRLENFQLECIFANRTHALYDTENDCAAILEYAAHRLPTHTVAAHVNNCPMAEYNLVGSRDATKTTSEFFSAPVAAAKRKGRGE